jgi:hypothetical protein
MSRRERQLRAAAFHEAGHAVAAYHSHVRLRRISIGADDGDALGWLDLWLPRVTPDDADNVRRAQAVERDIIVLLAGAQAERVGLGRSSCPAGGVDFYEAVRRAGAICRNGQETSACLRWLQLRTYALVQSPTWRQPIGTLAASLLERGELGARETRAIIRAAISSVRSESSIRHDDSIPTSPKHEARRRARRISHHARPRSGEPDDGSALARHQGREPE